MILVEICLKTECFRVKIKFCTFAEILVYLDIYLWGNCNSECRKCYECPILESMYFTHKKIININDLTYKKVINFNSLASSSLNTGRDESTIFTFVLSQHRLNPEMSAFESTNRHNFIWVCKDELLLRKKTFINCYYLCSKYLGRTNSSKAYSGCSSNNRLCI